ncbi:MAG: cbb3-type cytochrome c oxidase subunit I, partial [Bradyrhizobium sp.]
MVAMMLGFMAYIGGGRSPSRLGPAGLWTFLIGGAIFVLAFLAGGAASVPRRYAVHMAGWLPYDRIGVIGAGLVVIGTSLLVTRFFLALRSPMPGDGIR